MPEIINKFNHYIVCIRILKKELGVNNCASLTIGDIFFRLYFNPWHHTINEVFQRSFKGNLQNYD